MLQELDQEKTDIYFKKVEDNKPVKAMSKYTFSDTKEFIESDYNNNSANQFEISSNNYVVINIEAFPFPFTLVNGTTPITSNSEITNNTIYEAIFD